MKNSNDLKKELNRIDGKGYKAYKDIQGQYDFNDYILSIDHVQGDPFAAPSRVRIIVDQAKAKFPVEFIDKKYARIAVQDFLIRLFYKNINKYSSKVFGSGKSGLITISKCDQEILERTAIVMNNKVIEARIHIGFPARGRSVLAKELEKILYEFLPSIIKNTLFYNNIDKVGLLNRVKLVEDQEFIRKQLDSKNLVAFIANESILPRESGVSSRPLKGGIRFKSPKSMEVSMELPNKGTIYGMGIQKGVSIIVGGGYHGKSTLLKALELGVYNHIEGDGREYVITDNSALKVRAEDGRVIHNDDISLFINNLPNKKDTRKFNSENASGSTSQAANIIEGIESGSKLFLIDEDTSATNFMIRDDVMQNLVSKEKEPITPFIERVRNIYDSKGISSIIVVGSSGDYFDIANSVIQMDEYEPIDVTDNAKELSTGKILKRLEDTNINIDFNRVIKKGSVEKGPKGVKIKTLGVDTLVINKENIDLRSVEQIVDNEQVSTIGEAFVWAEDNAINNKRNLTEVVDLIISHIENKGLLSITNTKGGCGTLAIVRKQELMAAFNRYRRLKM